MERTVGTVLEDEVLAGIVAAERAQRTHDVGIPSMCHDCKVVRGSGGPGVRGLANSKRPREANSFPRPFVFPDLRTS